MYQGATAADPRPLGTGEAGAATTAARQQHAAGPAAAAPAHARPNAPWRPAHAVTHDGDGSSSRGGDAAVLGTRWWRHAPYDGAASRRPPGTGGGGGWWGLATSPPAGGDTAAAQPSSDDGTAPGTVEQSFVSALKMLC